MALETINYLLALGTLVLQIVTAAFLLLFFIRKNYPDLDAIAESVARWGFWAGLVVALGASAMTLVHSEIFGLPPCPLCWWQRIFLYPQVILFALALWKRDSTVAAHSIALSVLGLLVAIYHHALQMFPAGSLPCPADGTVSCAQILFLEFNYITYPMMSATLFAFLIILMMFVRSSRN